MFVINLKPRVVWTKRWDELNPSDGFSAQERGNVGQFGFYPMYLLDANNTWCGSWSANINAWKLSQVEMVEIYSLQLVDTYSVAQKMGWLVYTGEYKSPMWGGDWKTASEILAAALVYAGQPVEILEERVMSTTFGGTKVKWAMSRIRTHCPSRPVYQYVTVVDKNNKFGIQPKGVIKVPLYGECYPFKSNFKPASCWIPDRWLNK